MKVSNIAVGLAVLLAACGGSSTRTLTTVDGERIFFDFDQYNIRPDARDGLQAQAEFLRANEDVRILLEGHADERGTREYNLALGARRANSARQFLIREGVAANRIETISFGKDRPWVQGTGERVWQQNRNVHTVVIQ